MINSKFNVGLYIDAANIAMNGGRKMRYEILRQFASHDEGEVVRLNAYVALDEERADDDLVYKRGIYNFHSALRDLGYKVVVKKVKRFIDDEGNVFAKANSDLDMAVDALLQSENLNRVILVTGDGDFVRVVRALQNKGCRVEVTSFRNVSFELRQEVDFFISGYLVPYLVPAVTDKPLAPDALWGEVGSRVRGVCYKYNIEDRYGFMRFMRDFSSNLWMTDTRLPNSPYESAYFHLTDVIDTIPLHSLPSRDIIFEFDLHEGQREGFAARNIKLVYEL